MKELNKIYFEDCLVGMSDIADKSIDCIISDLPYKNKGYNEIESIDLDALWEQYNRVIKDNGVIVLFATQPFTTKLIASNIKDWKYNWIWKKNHQSNFLNANSKPLTVTEDICVFSKAKVGSLAINKIPYNPQGLEEVNVPRKNQPNSKWRKNHGYDSMGNKLNTDDKFVQKFKNYPNNILEFDREIGLHPQQKPVALVEYLIKTYTNEGDTVLDSCIGSGTTAVAAKNTGRNYIGFENDEKYFVMACNRITE